jgi:iron(II)-dependent oxidoreductase
MGPRPGWAARVFRWLAGRGDDLPRRASGPGVPAQPSTTDPHRSDEIHGMVRRLIAEGRYVFVLLKEAVDEIGEPNAQLAWDLVHRQMALIPAGQVPVVLCDGRSANVDVGSFFLDRYAVSNRQFQEFVRAGGYDSLEIWPPEIWPSVSRFTDRMGQPGPRDWEKGQFPQGKADHPVVGVCWYEAAAYARWVGKRLPTASEWQKAGGWPEHLSGGECSRYPWGDVFDPKRANLWASGLGRTVPVDAFPEGSTPNGILQMCGNVWEWLADPLEAIPCEPGETFVPWKAMRRISGGAFNTYFPGEATCQFITGQAELDRRENIGFRCAVSVDQLRPLP